MLERNDFETCKKKAIKNEQATQHIPKVVFIHPTA
jgi:hypothetical protein